MIALGYEPLYLDEIMFTSKTNFQKAWANIYNPIAIDRKQTNQEPIACVASVTARNGVELVELYDKSVNKAKFEDYLVKLKAKTGDRKILLVLDNLSVHRSKWIQNRMSHHEYKWAFTAPYHPDSNAIETVFSQVKHHFKKRKLQSIV